MIKMHLTSFINSTVVKMRVDDMESRLFICNYIARYTEQRIENYILLHDQYVNKVLASLATKIVIGFY